jgi:hypothetical protein
MELSDDPNLFPEFAKEHVKRISLGKVYYVRHGRNAWWSTWVQTYLDGCMHTTLVSAKEYAETKRVQGSVWYISELPALLAEGDSLILAVTQINCLNVLDGYSAFAVRRNAPAGYERIAEFRDNYLVRGASLEGAYLSFDPDSRFWEKPPPKKDSIIRVLAEATVAQFETIDSRGLAAYRSKSYGGACLLNWFPNSQRIRATTIRRIVRNRGGRAVRARRLES